MDSKLCPQCGKPFEVGGRNRPKRNQIFCSSACRGLSQRSPERWAVHVCEKCGKSFQRPQGIKRFCSQECMTAVLSKERIGKPRPDLIGNRFRIGRRHSDETRQKMRANHKGMTGMHHSEATKAKMSGPNHYIWCGGKYSESYRERRRFQREMQPQVFQRDNYTCQSCGVRGAVLNVHHVQPWAAHPELRFSLDNRQTLCSRCHYQVTFGKPMPDTVTWGRTGSRR